ncbi:MAG: S-layer homology domain-containing protein [Elainellaceae cyanobacterium]
MVQSASLIELHVNPATGSDRAPGSQVNPLRTITAALRRARAGTAVRLNPGVYSTNTGEQFPLTIPEGVVITGNEETKGSGVVIEGSGIFNSPTFARQNVTVLPFNQSELRGVTVTNLAERGTGVWVESTNPAIANNTLINCKREGIFVTGSARPLIQANVILNNAASGIFFARFAKGEATGNICRQTGYGIAISDNAAPLLSDNQVSDNRAGIVISRAARPVLRNNRIENNAGDGLVVLNQAAVDLGHPQDPGGNVLSQNAQRDVRVASSTSLISVGNQINPVRVDGAIEWVTSQLPTRLPIVPPTIPTPSPNPAPSPAPQPSPTPPTPTPTPSTSPSRVRFPDIEGYWAQSFIGRLAERNIISGFPDHTFRPEAKLTRAQYAALISNAFDLPLKQGSRRFSDVAANFWAAGAISRAERMGFIAGFPDGTFRPHENLTRVQAIVSLVNGLSLSGGTPSLLAMYRDRAQIPNYATMAIARATHQRLVVNHPNPDYLEPMFPITRAEISAILYQSLVAIGQASAISSPFIVVPQTSGVSFSDLRGHWAAEFIRGLAAQGMLRGFDDGTFRPDAAMSRAHYAVLLANAFNPSPTRAPIRFIDVPDSDWAAPAIQQVYRGGLLSGFGDGTFQPRQDILRLHVLLSLANALRLPESDVTVLSQFADYEAIPQYARGAIASATQHHLVVNYPNVNRLSPNRGSTRAEVSSMVYQALAVSGHVRSLASPYIAGADIAGST